MKKFAMYLFLWGGGWFVSNLFVPAWGQSQPVMREWPQSQSQHEVKFGGDTLEFPVHVPEFTVNSLAGEFAANQSLPDIAVDRCGHYAIAWVDDRDGNHHIYVQFYNENDEPIGLNQRVSEVAIPGYQLKTAVVAANWQDEFVVAWKQNVVFCYAQRFNHFGDKIGKNFQISTVVAPFVSRPAIELREDGTLITVWSIADGPSQSYNTYVQLFHPDGTPFDYNVRLNKNDGGGFRITDMVAADSSGNFVVVYAVGSYHMEVYLQQFDSSGHTVGVPVIVSDTTQNLSYGFPTITATRDGRYMIVWHEQEIWGRVFDASTGQFLIPPTSLTNGYPYQGYHQVATNKRDRFFFQWYGGASTGVYVRLLDRDGNLLGDPQVLRRTNGNHFWGTDMKIAARETNYFYTTLEQSSNIYLQKYQTDFTPVGSYRKVHDDTTTAMQTSPAVAFNNQGRVQVSWLDRRSYRERVFAQAFDEQFRPLGDNIVFSDRKQRFNHVGGNKIIALPDGNFVHSFYSQSSGWPDSLVLRMVNPEGQIISPRVVVDTIYGDQEVYLNVTPDNRILVYWTSNFQSGNLYMRSFDFNLNPLITRQMIMTPQPGLTRSPYTIVPCDSGQLLVAWRYSGDDNTYIRLFNSEGLYEILPAIEASKLGGRPDKLYGYAADSDNYLLVPMRPYRLAAYRHYYSQREIETNWLFSIHGDYFPRHLQMLQFINHKLFFGYSAAFELDGLFINDNSHTLQKYRIHHFPPGNNIDNWLFNSFSADIHDKYLFLAYEDGSDYETRLDIRAKVLDISELDFDEEPFYPPPEDDLLLQNYPNPFNSRTTIRYELRTPHWVELAVYNALGQRVALLVNEFKEDGVYLVDFEGAHLPSGIYFCRLKAFKEDVIKMLMIK